MRKPTRRQIVFTAFGAIALVLLLILPMLPVTQRIPETAGELEHEIRSDLPVGSSLSNVEAYLKRRNIEFSYDEKSSMVYAAARSLKGSGWITQVDLMLKLHFDHSFILKSIDAKRGYTGL
jgi:hypothetical protein